MVSKGYVVKITELVLAIAILILHYQTMREMAVHNSFVTTGTYVGFAIVVIGTVLGLVTGNVVNKSVDLFFCVAGAILYLYSAWLSYNTYTGWTYDKSMSNLGITKSVLALVQGIVFIVDGFFTFKLE